MSTFNELIAQIGENPQIRAFGAKADYAPSTTHKGVIYFATDTQDILLNGQSYGGSVPKFTSQEFLDAVASRKLDGNTPVVKIQFEGVEDPNLTFMDETLKTKYAAFFNYRTTDPYILFYKVLEDPRKPTWATISSPVSQPDAPRVYTSSPYPKFYVQPLYNYSEEDYNTVQAAKSFLEATDPGNTTINKWKELEAFLAGITDTQTLTKLLQDVQTAAAADAAAKVKAVQDAFDEYKTQMNTVLEDIYRIIGTGNGI